jgi:molecular chaperone DnaK
LKKARDGEDKDALQRALSDLASKAQKLGEAIYKQSAGAAAPGGGEAPAGEKAGASKPDDEPVDADFEVKT